MITKNIPEVRSERQYYLDWLRVLAVFVVLLQHTVIIPTSLFEESEDYSLVLAPVAALGPAGITVFFLVSGASSIFALDRRTSGQYVKERILRLAVPYIVFSLLNTPYVFWLIARTGDYNEYLTEVFGASTAAQLQGSLWEFYPLFYQDVLGEILSGSAASPVWIATLGLHLWFIGFLFLFSVLGLPLLQWLRSDSARAFIEFAVRVATGPFGLVLFAVPIAVLGLVGDFIAVDVGYPNYQGWGAFLRYFAIFLLGALLYCDSRILDALRRYWPIVLVVGLIALGAWAYLNNFIELSATTYYLSGALSGVMEWCLALALLRMGMAVLNRNGNALKYCLGIVVAFYVLHWPVETTIAYWLTQSSVTLAFIWDVTFLDWLFGTLLSIVLLLAVIEFIVRPIPPLRFLLGVPKEWIPGRKKTGDQPEPVAADSVPSNTDQPTTPKGADDKTAVVQNRHEHTDKDAP